MTQSNKLNFKAISNEENIARIGGASFLPSHVSWPINPEGDKLTLLYHLPATFLNQALHTAYNNNIAISVFTTYNPNTYFLDHIIYHGDPLDLLHIKKGYTKVILHHIGVPRTEADYVIPAQAITVGEAITQEDFTGSKIGGLPSYLQQEHYNFDSSLFALQLYGNDCGEQFNNIFYLSDAVGYLFLDPEGETTLEQNVDSGIFFVQST